MKLIEQILRSEGEEIELLKNEIFTKLQELIKTDGVTDGVRSNTAEVKILHVIDVLPDEDASDFLSKPFSEIRDSLSSEGPHSKSFKRAVKLLLELQAEKVSTDELSVDAPLGEASHSKKRSR